MLLTVDLGEFVEGVEVDEADHYQERDAVVGKSEELGEIVSEVVELSGWVGVRKRRLFGLEAALTVV